jgi:uncharacterized protein YkwD
LPTPARHRRRLSLIVVAALVAVTAVTASAAPVAASTKTNMVNQLLASMNKSRAANGLRPLRTWTPLRAIADDRAAAMASTNTLSHTAAGGNVGTTLTNAGLQWYGYGEAIGETGYAWGSTAASHLYSMWWHSSPHRALILSRSYNYVGIGLAYRADNGTTWASLVFAETVDHSGAIARNRSISRSGTTIRFTWSGYDPLLQTHTAGLRSYDLQYRVDSGPWHTIRNDTKQTSITLYGRPHRHTYRFRVQAADRRGNLGKWTSEMKVWVP